MRFINANEIEKNNKYIYYEKYINSKKEKENSKKRILRKIFNNKAIHISLINLDKLTYKS